MELIDIMNEKDLFGSWQTDSNGKMVESIFTDKGSSHSYIQNFYDDEFKKYQDKDINFLEIGIMSGGCFLLWSAYFKNAKNIVGVDCTDEFLHPDCREIEGVDYYFHDAYDEEFVNGLMDFDIVIDDGQHTLESQLECIDLYLPKLNKGGVLIIEDVQDANHFEKFIEASEKISEDDNDDVEYEVECLDFRTSSFHQKKGWSPPDDMLFVVRKL